MLSRRNISICLTILLLLISGRNLPKQLDGNLAFLKLGSALLSGDLFLSKNGINWPELREAAETARDMNERRTKFLGIVYFGMGETERAKKVWQSSEGSADYLMMVGDYYWSNGRTEETRVVYDLALNLDPRNSRMLCRWGNYYHKLGNLEKALEFYRLAVSFNDFGDKTMELAVCNYQLGETLSWYGEWQGALPYFERASDIDQDNSKYRISLARAFYFGLGDIDRALEHLRGVTVLNPDDLWAYLVLSELYLRERKYDLAIDAVNQAVDISPTNSWPYVYRGRVYLQIENYHKAQNDFEKAVKISSNNVDAHCSLGVTYFNLGRETDALAELTAGTQIDPMKKWCLIELGKVYEALGRTDDAIREYNKVLTLDPLNEEALRRINGVSEAGER